MKLWHIFCGRNVDALSGPRWSQKCTFFLGAGGILWCPSCHSGGAFAAIPPLEVPAPLPKHSRPSWKRFAQRRVDCFMRPQWGYMRITAACRSAKCNQNWSPTLRCTYDVWSERARTCRFPCESMDATCVRPCTARDHIFVDSTMEPHLS